MSIITKRRVGRGLVLVAAALLLADGVSQLLAPPALIEEMARIGFAPESAAQVAIITLSCAALLAWPRTAPLGGLLTTGFLGGAICAHFRVGEIGSPSQLICAALGASIWVGLALADPRVSQFFGAQRAIETRDVR
jgi:hypothetical protein